MGEELGSRWSHWWVHSFLQISSLNPSVHDGCFHAALHARLLRAAEVQIKTRGGLWEGFDQAKRERLAKLLRTQLDEEAFAANWSEGRAMTMEQAVTYALEDSGG